MHNSINLALLSTDRKHGRERGVLEITISKLITRRRRVARGSVGGIGLSSGLYRKEREHRNFDDASTSTSRSPFSASQFVWQ